MSKRDNRLSGAISVGLPRTLNGRVDRRDLDDLYQFSPSGRSSFDLKLALRLPRKVDRKTARTTNVGVELYKLTRPLSEVVASVGSVDFRSLQGSALTDNFQLISTSRSRSNRTGSIASSDLEAGDYVIRVRQRKGDTRYRLALLGTPLDTPTPTPEPIPEPIPDPVPPPDPTPIPEAGNSLETALAIDLPLNNRPGFISDSDGQDYYKFSSAAPGDFKLDLFGLNADVNVAVLDGAGNVVKAATTIGSNDETMIVPLDAGEHFVRVFQATPGVTSNYALQIRQLQDGFAGRYADGPASAATLSLTGNPQTFTNYVVEGGKNSPEDFFKIDITQRSFLTLELKGQLGSPLDGNLDVQLFNSNNFANPALGIISNRPGTSAELLGGTLKPGQYFIRVLPSGTGEGSVYNLTMSLKPKQDIPTITRDIRFGSSGSSASQLTEVGGLAYFSAQDENETALWVSDGTLDGTKKLKAFNFLGSFTKANGLLYFVGEEKNSTTGTELWRTDGTASGTQLVKDIFPGTGGSSPTELTVVGDRLYFKASPTGGTDNRLFRTNTTGNDATEIVLPNQAQILGSAGFSVVDSTLFFAASDSFGNELWRIENAGTATPGTPTRSDLNAGPNPLSSTPSQVFGVNGKLYGSLVTGFNTTVRFMQINLGNSTATEIRDASNNALLDPRDFVTVGDTVYFTAGTSTTGRELWKFDTNGTTASVVDVSPGVGSSNPSNLVAVGNTVYFFADNGQTGTNAQGREIWRTTDTGAERIPNGDIRPG
ncbi:MAG: hypothetical protein MUF49_18320, partial [Oculatellaceae cyanobacterium Prado106]|nr:hypothetical protein [Oculatellaceae cyanobacterium Prado106]